MVKVKKHPDVEYRCILGRHWVAVPVVAWHCGGRLTGRERRERQAAVVEGRCASKQVAVQCCLVQCCARLEAGCSPEFHSVAQAPLTWQVVCASFREHHGRPGLEGYHNREGGGGQQRGGEVERAQHG